jgi:hypothetical protein
MCCSVMNLEVMSHVTGRSFNDNKPFNLPADDAFVEIPFDTAGHLFNVWVAYSADTSVAMSITFREVR